MYPYNYRIDEDMHGPRLSLGTNGLLIAALEINKFKSKVGGLASLG